MTEQEKVAESIAEQIGSIVAGHVGAIHNELSKGVLAAIPSILDAMGESQDFNDFQYGLRNSIRDLLLSMTLALRMETSITQEGTIDDLITELQALKERL